MAGGGKSCFWGCLGFGDCEASCQFDAIDMSRHLLPIVHEEKCTACGDCVDACPKDLISLHPVSHHLWVACSNQEAGDQLLEYCQVACTACKRCAIDARGELVTMKGNLPVIDYAQDHRTQTLIQRCPTARSSGSKLLEASSRERQAAKLTFRTPISPEDRYFFEADRHKITKLIILRQKKTSTSLIFRIKIIQPKLITGCFHVYKNYQNQPLGVRNVRQNHSQRGARGCAHLI